jgi:hypothetical protein
MTIGLAILIVAILFLIDRNHVWPQVWQGFKRAMKGAAVAAIFVAVFWGGFVVWSGYNFKQIKAKAEGVPAATETTNASGVDCYDGDKLLPDEAAAFGGYQTGCGPNHTPRPKSERVNVPPAELQHVERIEACQKQTAADPKDTPAQYQACSDIK